MMIKNNTLNEIKNCEPKRQEALNYVVKNCSEYMVTPEGNEHWLCGTVIVTHWAHDTGYSRKYMGLAFPDNFESWSFNNNKSAKEAFQTHHEMENA
jgi:hypothetical protein